MSFYQEPPTLRNQYEDDTALTALLARLLPEDVRRDVEPSLVRMGELASGPLLDLCHRHRAELPRHVPFDPWGRRVDSIEVSSAWQEFARVAAREGLVATAFERRHGAFSRLHQFALVYLFDRSSQVYTCPLAMTDGCARTLELHASAELKDRILTHLLSRDPATAWTSGQWMTERTGGSDVGLSETIAKESKDGWRLYGDKWFTSSVTSEVALTLARPEGNGPGGKGLALFFVDVRDSNGGLNGITVHRLKDKLGTRYLPTAELSLNGTPALPLCGLQNGVRNMASMLNITRTWNAVCAAASMRRGLALARDYARRRVAFGAPLAKKPLHIDTLADLAAEAHAGLQLAFFAVHLLGREETEGLDTSSAALLRLLQPVAKLTTGRQAVASASEVLEAFGGAGYVEDTGLPELLRDAQVLSIWEGTTNVLALEAYRAINKTGALEVCVAEVERHAARASHPSLAAPAHAAIVAVQAARDFWQTTATQKPLLWEASARRFCLTLGRSLALSLLCEQAQWNIEHGIDAQGATAAAERFAARGVNHLATAATSTDGSLALALGASLDS